MKKSLFILIIFMMFGVVSFGQGNENFANYPETGNAYHTGTFLGQDGSTWSYTQCRGDSVIVAPSPTLGKARNPTSSVISGSIPNGCGTLSFDYKQPFSTAVNLNVYVNGLMVKNVTSTQQGFLYNSGPIVVNTPGNFILKIKQADSTASGQVTIDNFVWTAYSGGPAPEPTNYPTSFTASPSPYSISLSWVDAVGAQLPAAYLILASDQNNIVAPVDGTPVPDDANLADGHGALNVLQGSQVASFSNLLGNKQYFFMIFPYTNSGTLINYKTDGTAPAANATTPNTAIIQSQNFATFSLSPWIPYNVLGTQVWTIDSIHGIDLGPCAKVSGFAGTSNENEDWLISPPMNFNLYYNEAMTFQSAYKYAGPALQVLISNDYDGTTNPNDFIWTTLTANWSAGNWVWTPSGNVNLSGVNGPQVYVAFKYTSTATESSTWELDNIVITGDLLEGVSENVAQSKAFTVYPNPSSTQCTLGFNSTGTREIKLLSVIGSVVFETVTDQQNYKLNLQHLSKGIYFIQVHNTISNTTQVNKLIIQ